MQGQNWLGLCCVRPFQVGQRQPREQAGWGRDLWAWGLDTNGWKGGSIRTVCRLQGPVVLLGAGCLLWVALALGDGGDHKAGNIAESG